MLFSEILSCSTKTGFTTCYVLCSWSFCSIWANLTHFHLSSQQPFIRLASPVDTESNIPNECSIKVNFSQNVMDVLHNLHLLMTIVADVLAVSFPFSPPTCLMGRSSRRVKPAHFYCNNTHYKSQSVMIAELTLSQHLVPVLQHHRTMCKFIIPRSKIVLLLSGKWSSLIPPIKCLGLI